MTGRFYIGIDGGGSNLRVAVVNQDMKILAQCQRGSVNPSSVGRETSAALIQDAMREAIQHVSLTPSQITAVGIGVAGAPANREAAWLREIVAAVTPDANIVPSADQEIALVAARGERYGLLILAGTGSNVYGVNRAGESAQVGGWGYLVGDEGSGYWIGMEAIRAFMRHHDGRGYGTRLTDLILTKLELDTPDDLIRWLYATNRTREVAALAELVLQTADLGDSLATSIIERGAQELLVHANAVLNRLKVESLPIAFTGGLLERPNMLSHRLCELLKLDALPPIKYPQVVGAALLAAVAPEQTKG